MVAESGAELLDADAARGADRAAAAARDRGHARTCPRRGRCWPRRPRRAPDDVEALARARPRARARARWSSPAATATQAIDVFFDGRELVEIPGERHPDGAAHGSGCTHSSVLAARLALGRLAAEAARAARQIAARAVRDGLREIGAGAGPGRRARAGRSDRGARRRAAGRPTVAALT